MESYRTLFAKIIEFKKLRPWRWIGNDDIIGVENPKTKQKGYCCVMGAGGGVFGLAVYLEHEGLRWLCDRLDDVPVDSYSGLAQDYISVTFRNVNELNKKDKQLLKDLGLQFKGELAYPLLRSVRPGEIHRMITEPEADFLTMALDQVMEISPRIKENPDYFYRADGMMLLRVMETGGWTDSWIDRDVLLTPGVMDISPLLKNIRMLTTFPKNESAVWALDMFFLPDPVAEGKKSAPFFPLVIVLVDLQSGIVLSFRMTNYNNYKKEAQQLIIEAIKNAKTVPATIEMIRSELFFTIAPFKQPLGIELIHANHIPAVEYIKKEFITKISGKW